jgi:hypothetical protein
LGSPKARPRVGSQGGLGPTRQGRPQRVVPA